MSVIGTYKTHDLIPLISIPAPIFCFIPLSGLVNNKKICLKNFYSTKNISNLHAKWLSYELCRKKF